MTHEERRRTNAPQRRRQAHLGLNTGLGLVNTMVIACFAS